MKKSLLLLASAFVLVACGGQSNTATTTTTTAKTTAAATTTKAAATTTAKFKDGTYKAEASDFDSRGWKVSHTITVKDGKITESKFDYVNKEGKLKSADEAYNKNMKDKSGVSSKEATDKLNAQLVATQDVAKVETVTGATSSTKGFKQSAELLLKAASEGKTDVIKFTLAH